ncbi:hypothetical protein C1H46_007035 [Malus baccata]|uniref:Protein TIFY n=1 Tax=Malus baccata TaxID=106549 RepID=A0A540N8K4_MALBA|nr:hypothetical protein C1H46_007035 [Malus baccata]
MITKDYFMKTENNNSSDIQEFFEDQKKKNRAIISNAAGFDGEKGASTPNDCQQENSSLKPSNDMSWLFRKYLFTRSHSNSTGKSNTEAESESEIVKRHSSPGPSVPPMLLGSNDFRGDRLSLLERKLLPGLRCGDQSNKTSTTEQLTIFYNGIVHVYDDIPADKAKEIMCLASENSSSKPLIRERLKKAPPPLRPQLSVSKLRAGVPMARRHSLQCFLEKRRGRIINKYPYALHPGKQEDNEAFINNQSNENHKISLSPFPSRLGYFYPKLFNQGC